MSGGGDVQAPVPTSEEKALTREQTDLLRQQKGLLESQLRTQDLLAPFLYEQAGLKPLMSSTVDPSWLAREAELTSQLGEMRKEWEAVPLEGGDRSRLAVEGRMAPLQDELTRLQDRIRARQGTEITGFERLPLSAAALREQEMQELSFQQARQAFEMQKAEFEAQQADLPNLQKQRELETKFRERSLADLEEQAAARGANAEVEGLIRQRTLAALKGELPVNPALLRELGQGEEQLRAQLMKQLGTGYETSTPGIEALAQFNQRKSELLEGARRGDLQLGEQMNFAREASRSQRLTEALPVLASRLAPADPLSGIQLGYTGSQLNSALRQQQLGNLMGISQGSLPSIQAGLGVSQGYAAPLNFLQNNRQQQFSAAVSNMQNKQAAQGAYGSLFGTALMAMALA